MEKKRFYKAIRAFKHNGEICEFSFMLPYTFNEAYALAVDSMDFSVCDLMAIVPVEPMRSFAVYIVTLENKKDTLLYSYRVVSENSIKAIDLSIKEFENVFHHCDIDVVGLVRSKQL